MGKLIKASSYGLGNRNNRSEFEVSPNHFSEKTISPDLKQKIASLGLKRVAGNQFICESTKDFWKVKGGKIIRITTEEVDNGESLTGAPANDPASFLRDLLNDLTF